MFRLALTMVVTSVMLVALACVRAGPAELDAPTPVDPKLSVVDPAYGSDPSQPDLLALGESLDHEGLPLAEVLASGPVVVLWFGGAEHVELTAWVRELAAGLPEFEARGATLVIVRPLPPERADAFASELGLQAVVIADESGALARAAKFSDPSPAWALLILDRDASLRYRKLAGRRPAIDELLALLDGGSPRCCVDDCPAPACE